VNTFANYPSATIRNDWGNRAYRIGTKAYIKEIQGKVSDPENVSLTWCPDCNYPDKTSALQPVARARRVCTSCVVYYTPCGRCRVRNRNLVAVNEGGPVCQECIDQAYTYCRDCAIYYHTQYARAHRHAQCCESPAQDFTFPCLDDVVGPEERVTVDLERGKLTAVGRAKIVQYLLRVAQNYGDVTVRDTRAWKMYHTALEVDRDVIGRDVKTPEGTYTTRLKRYAYKNWALKIDADIMTEVGNMVFANSRAGNYTVEVTRDLNKNPSEFGNTNSCWWTNYKSARCALKTNGGLALRSMNGDAVTGRVWVMPLKIGVDGEWAPTFDTHVEAYFVFNGYGDLTETVGPQVLMAMVADSIEGEVTYIRTTPTVSRYYVNSNSGYLVGSANMLKAHPRLTMNLTEHSDLFRRENSVTKRAMAKVSARPKLKKEVKAS
jgi:hypothetical protein